MRPEDWRPWGYFEVLTEEADYKVKRIVVQPGKRLSLQFHLKRSEHWIVVAGWGKVTRGEEQTSVTSGSYVYLPLAIRHRIENIGEKPLVFIEVQQGGYLGEDDIIRTEDDFGRV